MAFKLRQDVYQVQTRRAVLDSAITVEVGDLVIPLGASNAVTNATATLTGSLYVLGVVVGFSGPNGEVIGQGQSDVGTLTPAQVTTSSNNYAAYTSSLTGGQVNAVYVPISPEMEFSATLSATAETTAGSSQKFTWFSVTDARTVNEASVVPFGSASAPLQIFSYGLDPLDTTNHTIICRVAESVNYRP